MITDLPTHRREAGQTSNWISNKPNPCSRWKPA